MSFWEANTVAVSFLVVGGNWHNPAYDDYVDYGDYFQIPSTTCIDSCLGLLCYIKDLGYSKCFNNTEYITTVRFMVRCPSLPASVHLNRLWAHNYAKQWSV